MKDEVLVLQEMLSELAHRPKFTYVTCSKDQQTRFYAANEQGFSEAGTVVDQQVTSVSDYCRLTEAGQEAGRESHG